MCQMLVPKSTWEACQSEGVSKLTQLLCQNSKWHICHTCHVSKQHTAVAISCQKIFRISKTELLLLKIQTNGWYNAQERYKQLRTSVVMQLWQQKKIFFSKILKVDLLQNSGELPGYWTITRLIYPTLLMVLMLFPMMVRKLNCWMLFLWTPLIRMSCRLEVLLLLSYQHSEFLT